MRRLTVAVLVLGLLLLAGSVAAGSGKTVKTLGGDSWKTNVAVNSNHRFSPGNTIVKSGETVTFLNADTVGAPHTVSIVDSADLPDSFEALIFGCAICDAVFDAHFPLGPPVGIVDPGADGFNEIGDSVFFFPAGDPGPPGFPVGQFEVTVTADPGTALSYFCAIHPWMQGTIKVSG